MTNEQLVAKLLDELVFAVEMDLSDRGLTLGAPIYELVTELRKRYPSTFEQGDDVGIPEGDVPRDIDPGSTAHLLTAQELEALRVPDRGPAHDYVAPGPMFEDRMRELWGLPRTLWQRLVDLLTIRPTWT